MTREIKFKIWDGHTKSFFDTDATHYLPKIEVDENGILRIITEDDTYHLLQYTGLLDKNGVEIYENNILKFDGELNIGNILVQWNNRRCAYSFGGTLNPIDMQNCIVIGNLYQNPELLTNIKE